MRQISQLIGLQANEQVEITLQITAYWKTGTRIYASKDLGFPGVGRILKYTGLQAQRDINETSTAGSCSVTLDDYDQQLKFVQQGSQIEGTRCTIGIYLPNIPGVASQIFEGRITSPVSWNEGDRTLSFDITPNINVGQVGFAVGETDVSREQKIAIGKTLPVTFGTAALVECPLVQTVPEVTLSKPFYFGYDPSSKTNIWKDIKASGGIIPVEFKLNKEPKATSVVKTEIDNSLVNLTQQDVMFVQDSSAFEPNKPVTIQVNKVLFEGSFSNKTTFNITKANVPYQTKLLLGPRDAKDPDKDNYKVGWLRSDNQNYDMLGKYTSFSYDIDYKDNNKNTNTATEFLENVVVRQEGKKLWFKYPFTKALAIDAKIAPGTYTVPTNQVGKDTHICPSNGYPLGDVYPIHPSGLIIDFTGEWIADLKAKMNQRNYARVAGNTSNYEALIIQLQMVQNMRECFWRADAGDIATQYKGPTKDRYIANLGSVKDVKSVFAIRTNENNENVIVPVPSKYYKIIKAEKFLNNKNKTCAVVEMTQPLTSYADQGWARDNIWCTVESEIPSNTAEQIRYILNNFTNLTVDNESFDDVKNYIKNYPSNFAITDVKDALIMAGEMAWQARCALMIDGTKVGLKYLSKRTDANNILTEDVVDEDSVSVSFTPIESLITKIKATFKRSGAPQEFDPVQQLVYTNNIDKYGVRETAWDFYIYNNLPLVKKSLDFWGYRRSNSWKLIGCQTAPNFLSAQIFEEFSLQLLGGALGSAQVHAHLDAYNFDIQNNILDLQFWTPTLCGSIVEDSRAYLKDGSDDPEKFTYNPADGYSDKADYVVTSNRNKQKDVDELIRELRKQQQAHLYIGKITNVDGNKLTVNYYPNCDPRVVGSVNVDATGVKTFTVYDASPGEHKQVGSTIYFETGQDGVNYSRGLVNSQVFAEYDPLTGRYTLRDKIGSTQKMDKIADKELYYSGSPNNFGTGNIINLLNPSTPTYNNVPIFYDSAGTAYLLQMPTGAMYQTLVVQDQTGAFKPGPVRFQ